MSSASDPGDLVSVGQTIGSIESFKAVSDLYCVASSAHFAGANPELERDPTLLDLDPYDLPCKNFLRYCTAIVLSPRVHFPGRQAKGTSRKLAAAGAGDFEAVPDL